MSITMSEYESYLEACEEAKRLLSQHTRQRDEWWRPKLQVAGDEMERIRGAAIALEAVFGIHDFVTVDKLGMEDARRRFHKACDMEIAASKRREEVFA